MIKTASTTKHAPNPHNPHDKSNSILSIKLREQVSPAGSLFFSSWNKRALNILVELVHAGIEGLFLCAAGERNLMVKRPVWPTESDPLRARHRLVGLSRSDFRTNSSQYLASFACYITRWSSASNGCEYGTKFSTPQLLSNISRKPVC